MLEYNGKKYYTAAEAAKELHRNTLTIRRCCKKGTIEAFKYGNNWLITKEAMDKFFLRNCLKVKEGEHDG